MLLKLLPYLLNEAAREEVVFGEPGAWQFLCRSNGSGDVIVAITTVTTVVARVAAMSPALKALFPPSTGGGSPWTRR